MRGPYISHGKLWRGRVTQLDTRSIVNQRDGQEWVGGSITLVLAYSVPFCQRTCVQPSLGPRTAGNAVVGTPFLVIARDKFSVIQTTGHRVSQHSRHQGEINQLIDPGTSPMIMV